ncbi:MAG: hypothetical protein ACLPN1_03330 [Dissulfurispiraceae bacterium]
MMTLPGALAIQTPALLRLAACAAGQPAQGQVPALKRQCFTPLTDNIKPHLQADKAVISPFWAWLFCHKIPVFNEA